LGAKSTGKADWKTAANGLAAKWWY
jgi:hypothetical protein